MSVWFAIPSKRPVLEAMKVLDRWLLRGYKVMVMRDPGDMPLPDCVNIFEPYPGYGLAVNHLVRLIFAQDPECHWVVTGGDDYLPDETKDSNVIAQECSEHFATTCQISGVRVNGSFGVMQPCGDRWMLDEQGRSASERVCDAPWLGREFCRRMYGGTGPYHAYHHFYVDEELHEVSLNLGVLWHRQDIKQVHQHWSRLGEERPSFLHGKDWDGAKALFSSRKAYGFPGHEPVSV